LKALITGASSGIGRDIAYVLFKMGYDLIVTARREDRLIELQKSLGTHRVQVICADLSNADECYRLYNEVKNEEIDMIINNAGFGIYGSFDNIDLTKELEMLDVNIRAVHILTKLFIRDFKQKNSGYILNVASSAGFLPGPMLSSYYASKAYVLRLTQAIHEELRRDKSRVYIGALCPGPVKTEFNEVAGTNFGIHGLEGKYVAEYAVNKMLRGKTVIVPGTVMKIARFLVKNIPDSLAAKTAYLIQKSRNR
jgi:short-subunit dehydrogenase